MYYTFKNKEFTKEDLYMYREKHIKFSIISNIILATIIVSSLTFLLLFGETESNRELGIFIVLLTNAITIFASIKHISFRLQELKNTNNISFSMKKGIFKYKKIGTRDTHTLHYYLDDSEFYSSYISSKFRKYNNKNVEIYFYVNDKNINEAFLLNEIS